MKKVVFLLLGVLAGSVRQAPAQITGFQGELRYQHRYQDVLSGGLQTSSRQMSPMLSLGVTGQIVSPRLAIFSLRTNLSSNFNNAGTGVSAYSGSQYSWDFYDFTMGLLQYSLVKFDIGAREGVMELTVDQEFAPPVVSKSRRMEQSITVGTNKIRFLPSTTLSYERARAWSLTSTPFDQRSEIASIAMSTVNGSTTLNLSGSMTDLREEYTGIRERYISVDMDGRKEFDGRNRIDLSSSFNSYPGFRSLSGSLTYSWNSGDRLSTGTSLFGNTYAGSRATTRILSATHVFRIVQDEHFQYALTGLVRSRDEVHAVPPGEPQVRIKDFDWSAGFDAQHVREVGFAMLTNGLSGFYGEQHALDFRRTLGGRFSLGLQAGMRDVQGNIYYSLAGDLLENRIHRRHVAQNADARVTANIGSRITSTTSGEFRDDRYFGDVQSFRDRSFVVARQSLAARFKAVIPFTLGAGGSVTWYYTGLVGRTYGWNLSFSSGNFFVRGLSASYMYSRTFDPYFQREVIEQSAEFRLQWRRLTFELRLRQYELFHRIRDVLFTVSRPF